MSYISTGVEYALHCLIHLTRSRDFSVEDVSVRDLAELQGIPNEYLAKIFTKLAKADLVCATEGIKGGFRLARAGNRITVHDVVVAIDGEKPIFDGQEIHRRCAIFGDRVPAWAARGACAIQDVMQSTEKGMRAEMKKHTVTDLALRISAKASPTYGPEVAQWLSDRTSNRQ
ncbi:RrF2 family transcriptional regulator [Cupriavidus pampae]|uniref:RrF2 family transcriptional regulator n=1 Tax=Cupriavidus pampae TaxID=659251 RepID=UPI001CC6FCCC|nr:Rrf2 family transcriptional regulator [Cupriavidus pampae]